MKPQRASLRHGRGVSFHEFDLTMKNAAELEVVSGLPLWLRRERPVWLARIAAPAQA